MGANDTPLPDLVELSGIASHTTYTATGGGILGVVDNATYTDTDAGNTSTYIDELHETSDINGGTISIGGTQYNITIAQPTSFGTTGDVTVGYSGGGGIIIEGDGDDSFVTFITATPTLGGSPRYFAVFSDGLGDVGPVSSITTKGLEGAFAGDVDIVVSGDNNVTAVCFLKGTMIETPNGAIPVEALKSGTVVSTLDHGPQHVLWHHAFHLSEEDLRRQPKLRPVRIKKGALGGALPTRDLYLSPQHRILVRAAAADGPLEPTEVLVRAVRLVGLSGIDHPKLSDGITYYHFLCERHEIVFAEDAPVETLLRGTEALSSLDPRDRLTMGLLPGRKARPARPILHRRKDIDALLNGSVATVSERRPALISACPE